MSIEKEITSRLKEAMRSKNQKELGVLRMVKTQATTAKTASGFEGETDDAFWLDVIAKYVKQQQKALVEFEKAGEAGKNQVEQLLYEIAYLEPFLPQKLSEGEVRKLVREAIDETGAAGSGMIGRVMGAVMKKHKDEVDAAMVKRIAAEELG